MRHLEMIEIEADLRLDEAVPQEGAVHREAMARGLVSVPDGEKLRRAMRRVARVAGGEVKTSSFRAEYIWPHEPSGEELARWAGWAEWFLGEGIATVKGGPNGGVSRRSTNDWVLRFSLARRFGFAPGRLIAAVAEARAEARSLGIGREETAMSLSGWVRPSPRKTRRAVRRWWISARGVAVKAGSRLGSGAAWSHAGYDSAPTVWPIGGGVRAVAFRGVTAPVYSADTVGNVLWRIAATKASADGYVSESTAMAMAEAAGK